MNLILLTKKTEYCKVVQNVVRITFPEAIIVEGDTGDPLPDLNPEGAFIISFLSPWIIPEKVLEKAGCSINFHPASPEYPGSGCYNFAIYNQENEFGFTCHHMRAKVDSGKIIKVIRFPLYETDTVFTLKHRTQDFLLKLFYEIFGLIIRKEPLPESDEQWLREPYRIKDLKKLCRITRDMTDQEIDVIVRATYFPGAKDGPYIDLNGKIFRYDEK